MTLNGNTRIRIPSISGPGLLLADFSTNTASLRTFVAVSELSNEIVLVNDASDFTQLDPGTFHIYSVFYESGLNPQSWIGQSIDELFLSLIHI